MALSGVYVQVRTLSFSMCFQICLPFMESVLFVVLTERRQVENSTGVDEPRQILMLMFLQKMSKCCKDSAYIALTGVRDCVSHLLLLRSCWKNGSATWLKSLVSYLPFRFLSCRKF